MDKVPYLFDSPPWALIKFLDLASGCLFEVGAHQIFTTFSKCSMFILQLNDKW